MGTHDFSWWGGGLWVLAKSKAHPPVYIKVEFIIKVINSYIKVEFMLRWNLLESTILKKWVVSEGGARCAPRSNQWG